MFVARVRMFFLLWLNDIPLYVYTNIGGHSGCFHPLVIVDNAAKNMGVQSLPDILSNICLDVSTLLDRFEYFLVHFSTFDI